MKTIQFFTVYIVLSFFNTPHMQKSAYTSILGQQGVMNASSPNVSVEDEREGVIHNPLLT